MHIAMVSDHETSGGAAVAASRLATGLLQIGHEVTRIVAWSEGQYHPWETVSVGVANRYVELTRPLGSWSDLPMRPVATHRLQGALEDTSPDLINLHNLHGAFSQGWSPELVRRADALAPTLWTLHDMWSFTGRCAYSYECTKFLTGCDATCPTPEEYPALAPSRIAGAWAKRRDALGTTARTIAVAPSRWLQEEAAAGLWGPSRVTHIPYGLPLETFSPRDKRGTREALGIRQDRPVLVAVAQGLNDPRKGMDLLVAALRATGRPITLVTVGRGALAVECDHVDVINLGFAEGDRMRALAFNAADVMVHPARADNLPLVVQESIACGTPVVAFRVGGLPDMVRPGRTGWLVEDLDAQSLTATLDAALSDTASLGDTCRAVAVDEWSMELQAERYVELGSSVG